MLAIRVALSCLILSVASTLAVAAAAPDKDKNKDQDCLACHGQAGNEVRRRKKHFHRSGQACRQRPRSSQLQRLPHRYQGIPASLQGCKSPVRHMS